MIISREEAYKWVFSYDAEQFGTGYSSITKAHNYTVDKLFDYIEHLEANQKEAQKELDLIIKTHHDDLMLIRSE